MAKKTRYSDEFRTNALLLVEASGYPEKQGGITRTAKHIKVPESTLRSWWNGSRNPPPAEMRAEKRQDLADMLRNEIDGALGAMKGARDGASYRDLGTVAGILIDKLQLITGKPTEISEINDVTNVDYSKLTTDQLRQLVAIAESVGTE